MVVIVFMRVDVIILFLRVGVFFKWNLGFKYKRVFDIYKMNVIIIFGL